MSTLDAYQRYYRLAVAGIWAGVVLFCTGFGIWMFFGMTEVAIVMGTIGGVLVFASAITADEYAERHNREVWRREYNR